MAVKIWRSHRNEDMIFKALMNSDEIILFDTETTGLKASEDRIIEIAAIKYKIQEDFILVEIDRLHEYINVSFELPPFIVELTGITNEQLSAVPTEDKLFDKIYSFIGSTPAILGAHNLPFDLRFLRAMYQRYGKTLEPIYGIDTLEMARDLLTKNEVENHKLSTLAEYFGISDEIQFHSAIEDVSVTGAIFGLLLLMYEKRPKKAHTGKLKPVITEVNYWAKDERFPRIYVNTESGTIYYDVRQTAWCEKDMDMDSVDMDWLENEVLRITWCESLTQFAEFKGKVRLN